MCYVLGDRERVVGDRGRKVGDWGTERYIGTTHYASSLHAYHTIHASLCFVSLCLHSTHTNMHTYTYTHIQTYKHTNIQTYTHTHRHICRHAPPFLKICTCPTSPNRASAKSFEATPTVTSVVGFFLRLWPVFLIAATTYSGSVECVVHVCYM
jgi:hypothetical protein